jgi:hypothetical protein
MDHGYAEDAGTECRAYARTRFDSLIILRQFMAVFLYSDVV